MVKDTCCLWVHVCSVIGHALLERQNLCCLTALTPWLPGWVPGCREAQDTNQEIGKSSLRCVIAEMGLGVSEPVMKSKHDVLRLLDIQALLRVTENGVGVLQSGDNL